MKINNLLKMVLAMIVGIGVYTLVAQSTGTLYYCCTPNGQCVGRGYDTMGQCRQACAGGDEHARCQARQVAIAPPAMPAAVNPYVPITTW